MKKYFGLFVMTGMCLFMTQAFARPMEMSQKDAADFIEGRAYLACDTDADCILTGNPCGQLIAMNKADHEIYAFAAALYGAEISCPASPPQKTSSRKPVCRENMCHIEHKAD